LNLDDAFEVLDELRIRSWVVGMLWKTREREDE